MRQELALAKIPNHTPQRGAPRAASAPSSHDEAQAAFRQRRYPLHQSPPRHERPAPPSSRA